MSDATVQTPPPRMGRSHHLNRLPRWLRPGDQHPRGDPAAYVVRTMETALMIVVGLVLAAAVVWDVHRQVSISTRQAADERTWLVYALAHKQPLALQQFKRIGDRLLEHGTTDFPCQPTGLTRAVEAHQHRLCLMIDGSIRADGLRTVEGGWFIAPEKEDRYINRWGCFGVAQTRHLCGLSKPPAHLLRPETVPSTPSSGQT